MKTRLLTTLILTALMTACGGGGESAGSASDVAAGTTTANQTGSTVLAVTDDGVTTVAKANLAATLATIPLAPMSDAERTSLQWMREEEKLAHDVYATLYGLWNMAIFNNIATSETTHTEAIKTLIDRYALTDPAAGKAVGAFTNTTLQGLYDTLVARGRASLIDALLVGAEIEDLDIRDLETQKAAVDNADILMVYDNLLTGSRNHLRAFTKVLAQYSVSYTPKYITREAYDAIVSTGTERGSGR